MTMIMFVREYAGTHFEEKLVTVWRYQVVFKGVHERTRAS